MVKTSAANIAYEWVLRGILLGDFPGGEFIDEASVCEASGVSRTPVREAFNRLAGERYVKLVPRRGALVRETSSYEVRDAFRSRLLVEREGIRLVAPDPYFDVSSMHDHLATMREFVDSQSPEDRFAFISADKAFHRSYVAALESPLLLDFYDNLWTVLQLGLNGPEYPKGFIEAVDSQHADLLRQIESGDTEAALATLADHLQPFSRFSISYRMTPAPN